MTSARPWLTFLLSATALIAACCSLLSFEASKTHHGLTFNGHFESGTGSYFFVEARQRPDKVPGEGIDLISKFFDNSQTHMTHQTHLR